MQDAREVAVTADAELAHARRLVRDRLAGYPPDLVHSAELVVSELATNSLLHGGGRAAVSIGDVEGAVRLEVADSSPLSPMLALASDDTMTGRGIALVVHVASRWGVDRTDTGKVVWVEIDLDDAPTTDPGAADVVVEWEGPRARTESVVHVELGEVPTSLLVAAKRHVDNLVREFTLAMHGGRSGTTSPVPKPLMELIDRVVHNFEEARVDIKRQATVAARTGERHTRLALDLPVGAADAAEAYLAALDEVDAYSRANRLLTLETPPQHRVFRHWYIGEIIRQLRAAEDGETEVEPIAFEDRLLAEIDAAEAARRSADRAARLYTVAFALSSATTVEEVARAVLEEGVAALAASGGGLLLATDDERLAVPATVGYDDPLVERLRAERRDAELPAAHALRTGEPVWLETVETRNERFPLLVGFEPETIAMCAVPVVAAGDVLGALRFSFTDRRLFDVDEQRFVLALAAEAADALQRAIVLEREHDARRRLARERDSLVRVISMGEALARGVALDEVLQLAIDASTHVVAASVGLLSYDHAGRAGTHTSPDDRSVEAFGSFAPNASGAEVVRSDDVAADPRFGDARPTVRSYLAVPLTASSGVVLGCMAFGHPEPARFRAEHEQLIGGIARQVAAAIENEASRR